jgi:hypothetical protein
MALVRSFSPNARIGVTGLLMAMVSSLGVCTSWAGLLIFISRRWRGVPWPIEPGEWLLAVLGMNSIASFVVFRLPEGFFEAKLLVSIAVTCTLFFMPILSRRLATRWKVFFGLAMITLPVFLIQLILLLRQLYLLLNVIEFTWWLDAASLLIAIILVIVVSWMDRRDGRKHDWLHWIGIATYLYSCTAVPQQLLGAVVKYFES